MTNLIYTNHPSLSYNSTTRTFSTEISSVNLEPTKSISLYNPDTKVFKNVELYKVDKDASGEDIYGWRYKGTGTDGTPFYFLLIND